MKFSCLQENLTRGLTIVGRAIPSRSTLQITQNVLLTAEESKVTISATDLSIAMTTCIGAQVEEKGAVTIPARLLNEFINTLPAERVDIESTATPVGVNIKCASVKANINGTIADDFPPIPVVEDGLAAKIDPVVLKDAIYRVAFAAASEDSRPVLTGVKTEITGEDVKFAAADGYRLAVFSAKLEEAPREDIEFLIPARALNEISRLLGGKGDPVDFMVTMSSNQALFRVNDVEIVCSLLAGNFPNYNQLIPQSHTTRATLKADDFLQATKTAAIFARNSSKNIQLKMNNGDGGITVAARAEEVGDNKGQVAATIEGDDAFIAFNAKYLTDILDVLDGDMVLEMSSSSSPGVFKPLQGEEYTHVVMPIFVPE